MNKRLEIAAAALGAIAALALALAAASPWVGRRSTNPCTLDHAACYSIQGESPDSHCRGPARIANC